MMFSTGKYIKKLCYSRRSHAVMYFKNIKDKNKEGLLL